MRVYMSDMRRIVGFSKDGGLCGSGQKKWFAQHGLDWKDYVKNGIDIEVLRGIDDPFAQAVVRQLGGR